MQVLHQINARIVDFMVETLKKGKIFLMVTIFS